MAIPKKWNFDTGVDCSISFVFFEVAKECPVPSIFFREGDMHRVGDKKHLFLLKRYIGRFDTNNPSKGDCSEMPLDEEFMELAVNLHDYDHPHSDLSYCDEDIEHYLMNNNDGTTIDQYDTWFHWGEGRMLCEVNRTYASALEGEKLEAVKQFFPDLFEDIKPDAVPLIEVLKDYGDVISLKSNELKIEEHWTELHRVYFKVRAATGGSPFLIYINKESNKLYLGADMLDMIDAVERELFHWLHECFDFETGKATDFFNDELETKGWA